MPIYCDNFGSNLHINGRYKMEMYNPPHPGEMLLEGWIKPLGFSVSKFVLK